MKLCEQTVEEIEQQAERWVEESTISIERFCENVTSTVEAWEQQWQSQCTERTSQVCNALPWPLSAVCGWVTTLVCALVLVLVKVLRTVVTVLCRAVTTIIKSLKKIIATILVSIVRTVCRFVPATEAEIEDVVPDLTGVSFDRRDRAGNVVPFLWGVSTASLQVEGHLTGSDWHRFTTSPTIKRRAERVASLGGTRLQIESPGRAIDHWDLAVLADDLDRAVLLGMNTYRFSIEWSRIQPNKPTWADGHIRKRRAADESEDRVALLRGQAQTYSAAGDYDRAHALETEAVEESGRAVQLRHEADAFADAPFEPTEFDQAAVDHYKAMLGRITQRGLTPILTLNHMTLPSWVLDPPIDHELTHLSAVEDERFRSSLRGWESMATVKAYLKLVRFVVPQFQGSVNYWITLNEPVGSTVAAGYLAGVWPPGFLGDGARARQAYFNLIEAHVGAYNVVKELAGEGSRVGVSHIVMYARRAPQTLVQKYLIGDNEAAKNQWNYAFNQYFLDAVVLGHFNREIWRKSIPESKPEWFGKLDFIAPQYYRAADIHHDVKIALRTSWFGGGFVADLRYSANYLASYLWNDLGWTVYPGGLYRTLNDLYGRYGLPILITENGIAEAEDRNRAAYTIAHLQQVLRAIKDGVDVIGYVHWSIADNWEWAFGYQEDARFGLFTVDRTVDPAAEGRASFPRHITEGALALQYVIANSRRIDRTGSGENPFDAVVARFGTISADGRAVELPGQAAGALWEGQFEAGGGPPFMLYLSRMPGDEWLGLLFLKNAQRWVRLQNVAWTANAEGDGALHFSHPAPGGDRHITYSAATRGRRDRRPNAPLQGTVRDGELVRRWSADRVTRMGLWRSTGGIPSHIAVSRLEGDFDRWHAKYLYARPWWAAGGVVSWNGDDISVVPTQLADIRSFEGTLSGDVLSGVVKLIGAGGGAAFSWEGRRVQDDVPF